MYLNFDVKLFEKYSFSYQNDTLVHYNPIKLIEKNVKKCHTWIQEYRLFLSLRKQRICEKKACFKAFMSRFRCVRDADVKVPGTLCNVLQEKEYFSKRLTSKFRYKMYLNFDVKCFEKYSFSYGTSHNVPGIQF